MSQNDEREVFESWWKSSGQSAEPLHTLLTENAAHAAWQARAALSQRAEVPQQTSANFDDVIPTAIRRYLRRCSSGGMSKKQIDIVQANVDEAERLGYFKLAIAEAMLAAAPQPQQAEQQGSSTAPEEDCPKCRGSQVRGFKRGVPCAHCKGTGTNPDHTRWEESQRAEQPRQMVALTDEVIVMQGLMMVPSKDCESVAKVFEMGVRFAEHAHGIPAPGGKE